MIFFGYFIGYVFGYLEFLNILIMIVVFGDGFVELVGRMLFFWGLIYNYMMNVMWFEKWFKWLVEGNMCVYFVVFISILVVMLVMDLGIWNIE